MVDKPLYSIYVITISTHGRRYPDKIIITILDTEKEITLDKLTSEAIRYSTLKHDTKMVDKSSSVQQVYYQEGNKNNNINNKSSSKRADTVNIKSHNCTKCKVICHKEGYCSSADSAKATKHTSKPQARNKSYKFGSTFIKF